MISRRLTFLGGPIIFNDSTQLLMPEGNRNRKIAGEQSNRVAAVCKKKKMIFFTNLRLARKKLGF